MMRILTTSMSLAWLCLCADAYPIESESSAEALRAWYQKIEGARGDAIRISRILYEADAAGVPATVQDGLLAEAQRKLKQRVTLKAWSDKIEAAAAKNDPGKITGIVREAERDAQIDAGIKENSMVILRDQAAKIMMGRARQDHVDEMAAIESAARDELVRLTETASTSAILSTAIKDIQPALSKDDPTLTDARRKWFKLQNEEHVAVRCQSLERQKEAAPAISIPPPETAWHSPNAEIAANENLFMHIAGDLGHGNRAPQEAPRAQAHEDLTADFAGDERHFFQPSNSTPSQISIGEGVEGAPLQGDWQQITVLTICGVSVVVFFAIVLKDDAPKETIYELATAVASDTPVAADEENDLADAPSLSKNSRKRAAQKQKKKATNDVAELHMGSDDETAEGTSGGDPCAADARVCPALRGPQYTVGMRPFRAIRC
jgi:hypothetical protein